MRVFLVGAGRLARVIASRLPDDVGIDVLARRDLPEGFPARARHASLPDVPHATAVLLAVPGHSVVEVLTSLAPTVSADSLVLNLATQMDTAALRRRWPDLRLAGAKVVGEASELEHGARGVVIVDGAGDEDLTLVAHLLRRMANVERENEATVLAVNMVVAEVMVTALDTVRARLAASSAPPQVVDAALRTLAPGVVRALATETAGRFLHSVADRVRQDARDIP